MYQIILAFIIGIQISEQFISTVFGYMNSRIDVGANKKAHSSLWILFSTAMFMNALRRLQVLFGANLLEIGYTGSRTAVSIDTIVVQTIISTLFLLFSIGMYNLLKRKYG